MNIAAVPPTPALTMPPFASRTDDAWWVELFGWKAVCEESNDTEPSDERLMRQASLLALLSVA